MKKILPITLLSFCLSFLINFSDESKASAESVWAFLSGNVNFYVEIDAAVVSNDGRGNYACPCEFQFVVNSLNRLSIHYDTGRRDFVMVYESPMAQAVFNVLRNHPQ